MIRSCQRCGTNSILTIRARAKDMHDYTLPDGKELEGYAIWFSSDGDTTEISLCHICGQVQGEFPMDLSLTDENDEEDGTS